MAVWCWRRRHGDDLCLPSGALEIHLNWSKLLIGPVCWIRRFDWTWIPYSENNHKVYRSQLDLCILQLVKYENKLLAISHKKTWTQGNIIKWGISFESVPEKWICNKIISIGSYSFLDYEEMSNIWSNCCCRGINVSLMSAVVSPLTMVSTVLPVCHVIVVNVIAVSMSPVSVVLVLLMSLTLPPLHHLCRCVSPV